MSDDGADAASEHRTPVDEPADALGDAASATDAPVADAPVADAPVIDVLVVVDVGGTKIDVGLMTRKGTLIDRARAEVDHDLGADALFESLAELVTQQIGRAHDHHRARPIALGVGCAGPMTPNAGSVSPLNIEAWRDFPLHDRLVELTGLAVYADVDTKALALAEGWMGAAVGRENFLAMVVSTGVGGGIVLDGQLLEGRTGNAGHIGHIIVEPNGRRCPCGARGCLEAEASGPAIEAITGRPPTEPSYEIMQRTGHLVGVAVASVCNLVDLDLAVVGGSVALGFGATFFNSAQEALSTHAHLAFSRGARIVPARLGDHGPLVGAGAVGIRGLHRARREARA